MIRGKKADEKLVMNKLITLILIALVILIVFILIFNPDFIMDKIRNIPGFETSGDEEIDLTALNTAELAALGHICYGTGNQIFGYLGKPNRDYKKIYVNKSGFNFEDSGLIVDWSNIDYIIKTESNKEVIGAFKQGKIDLDSALLRNYGNERYENVRKEFTLEFLRTLNGVYLSDSKSLLCKDSAQIQQTILKEQEVKAKLLSGESNKITLVFGGWFDVDDLAEVHWDFKNGKAVLDSLWVNKKWSISQENFVNAEKMIEDLEITNKFLDAEIQDIRKEIAKLQISEPIDTQISDLEEKIRVNEEKIEDLEDLKSDMTEKDIASLRMILSSGGATEFTGNIFDLMISKQVKIKDTGLIKNVPELNSILYRLSEVPKSDGK